MYLDGKIMMKYGVKLDVKECVKIARDKAIDLFQDYIIPKGKAIDWDSIKVTESKTGIKIVAEAK